MKSGIWGFSSGDLQYDIEDEKKMSYGLCNDDIDLQIITKINIQLYVTSTMT